MTRLSAPAIFKSLMQGLHPERYSAAQAEALQER